MVGHAGKDGESLPGRRELEEVACTQSLAILGLEDVRRRLEPGPPLGIPEESTGGIPVVGLALSTHLVVRGGALEFVSLDGYLLLVLQGGHGLLFRIALDLRVAFGLFPPPDAQHG